MLKKYSTVLVEWRDLTGPMIIVGMFDVFPTKENIYIVRESIGDNCFCVPESGIKKLLSEPIDFNITDDGDKIQFSLKP